MAIITIAQQRTTIGEFNPLLLGRSDIDQYLSACQTMTNVFTISQGGFTRRPGLEFIGKLPDGENIRIEDFLFNVDQRYILILSPGFIDIYKIGVFLVRITASFLTEDNIPFVNYEQVADTAFIINQDFRTKQLVRVSDINWVLSDVQFDFIPLYNFVPNNSNPGVNLTLDATEGTVKITASANVFVPSDVNQYIVGNEGRALIVKYISPTQVVCVTEIPFLDKDPIPAGDWTIQRGYEPVWSDTRGWPVCATFYGNRFWLGGSKSRPTAIWGSRVDKYFDFNPGSARADDAIDVTLDSDQLNPIVNMFSGQNLQIFTEGAEYIFLQQFGEPITPSNRAVIRQTSSGSKRGIKPISTENEVLYIQRDGKSIRAFMYQEMQQSYGNEYISLYSSHMLNNPIDFSARLSSNTDDIPYIIVINGDGTAIVAPYLRKENVMSFVRQTTDGKFKSACYDGEYIYVCVERLIDGETVNYLERFNNKLYLDSSKKIGVLTPTSTFTGLEHLEGRLCRVKADGSVMEDKVVVGGQVTIERPVKYELEIGIDYEPIVIDLPVDLVGQAYQSLIGKLKRIREVSILLYETQSITINDKLISFREFGPGDTVGALDNPPPIFTGTKRICGPLGWDYKAQIKISQKNPVPMTVLAWNKTIEVS